MLLKLCCRITLVAGSAYACGCTEPSVQAKKEHAEAIFRGTIIALRGSKATAETPYALFRDTGKVAVFRVSQIWKGDVGETFEMPAVEETSACVGFWPDYLTIGSDLLVYAGRIGSWYYTGICGAA
jgi:hypothetical protein